MSEQLGKYYILIVKGDEGRKYYTQASPNENEMNSFEYRLYLLCFLQRENKKKCLLSSYAN